MIEAVARLSDAIRGFPLVLLLLALGLYLTVLLRGLQFRRLTAGLRLVLRRFDEPEADGDLSHLGALAVSLASGIGAGSVVGVSAALAVGGPGALFWMWVAGVLAMATRYAEAVLGVRFRETDVLGLKSGGPMHYLENGMRGGRLGRALALAFGVTTVLAALGFGNGVQVNTIAAAVSGVFGAPPLVVGGVTAFLVGLAVLGGVRSIGLATGVLVPLMLVLYLGVAAWALIGAETPISAIVSSVFDGAFGARAAGGGVAGYTFAQVLRGGLNHGAFSSEAGTGTGAIAAATARTREPVRQALVAMIGPLVDTLVVSTLTGFVLIGAGLGSAGPGGLVDGVTAAQRAFTGLPNESGPWFVAVVLTAFAFSSILAWAYYGERCAQYVAGPRAVVPFRLVFIGIIPLGSVLGFELIWAVSDVFRGLMALPNLIGLVLLSGIVVRETKTYFGSQPSNGR